MKQISYRSRSFDHQRCLQTTSLFLTQHTKLLSNAHASDIHNPYHWTNVRIHHRAENRYPKLHLLASAMFSEPSWTGQIDCRGSDMWYVIWHQSHLEVWRNRNLMQSSGRDIIRPTLECLASTDGQLISSFSLHRHLRSLGAISVSKFESCGSARPKQCWYAEVEVRPDAVHTTWTHSCNSVKLSGVELEVAWPSAEVEAFVPMHGIYHVVNLVSYLHSADLPASSVATLGLTARKPP